MNKYKRKYYSQVYIIHDRWRGCVNTEDVLRGCVSIVDVLNEGVSTLPVHNTPLNVVFGGFLLLYHILQYKSFRSWDVL